MQGLRAVQGNPRAHRQAVHIQFHHRVHRAAMDLADGAAQLVARRKRIIIRIRCQQHAARFHQRQYAFAHRQIQPRHALASNRRRNFFAARQCNDDFAVYRAIFNTFNRACKLITRTCLHDFDSFVWLKKGCMVAQTQSSLKTGFPFSGCLNPWRYSLFSFNHASISCGDISPFSSLSSLLICLPPLYFANTGVPSKPYCCLNAVHAALSCCKKCTFTK